MHPTLISMIRWLSSCVRPAVLVLIAAPWGQFEELDIWGTRSGREQSTKVEEHV